MLSVSLPSPGWNQACSSNGLSGIHDPGVSLVVWKRPSPPNIGREVASLPTDAFPDVRVRVHAAKVGEKLAELFRTQGYDAQAAFPAWLSDMVRLSEIFIDLAGGRPVTARIESLDRTACPRFHVDRSYLRLVCTYRGPGTEWLDDACVDREAQRGGAPNTAIARCIAPSRMQTFWVGVMKGSRYPGCADSGLVHRSPDVEPGTSGRILFCLDC